MAEIMAHVPMSPESKSHFYKHIRVIYKSPKRGVQLAAVLGAQRTGLHSGEGKEICFDESVIESVYQSTATYYIPLVLDKNYLIAKI